MIPLFKGDGSRLSIVHRSLTINDNTEDPDNGYFPEIAVVRYALDQVQEAKAQRDGSEAYQPRKLSKMIRIDGWAKSTTIPALWDKVDALNEAYDPVLAFDGDTATFDKGFLPLDFSQPTDDVANYATGLIPLRYYARSMQAPVDTSSKFLGRQARFSIVMQAIDPRRYLQTLSSVGLSSGANAVDNTLAQYPSWPTLTLSMTGAGSAGWTIGDGTSSLVLALNLASAGQSIVVDMEKHRITVNGVEDMSFFTSGTWFKLDPTSETITITNLTNIGSATLQWRRAFV